MAFVRTKNINGNDYAYLVESRREGDTVRQIHIKYLGRADLYNEKQRKEIVEMYESGGMSELDSLLGSRVVKPEENVGGLGGLDVVGVEGRLMDVIDEYIYREPTDFRGVFDTGDVDLIHKSTGVAPEFLGGSEIATFKKSGGMTWLEINPDVWSELSWEQQDLVLRHEALHLEVGGHGPRFKRRAKEVGAPLSLKEVLGEPVELQAKTEDEWRYRTIKTFETPEKANEYVEENKNQLLGQYDKLRLER
ncbi:SprT-like domain-containing protein [Methanonatronarchaeum sp. AMET6-2]|uniref:SprT-like domain-containing protein n=1 Tax=Methanonatronarchaeum sp. AMET6-2 TaxID=2933293 RepID=UPI00120AECEA|nr:SprT-like domain-containing protein [Methanonatronarchaeum sp. AMET6-2]RZN63289.1 MAG: hypothetical protein EF811_00630 [Methanonatronarchaeia archaeon]UOY10050.1 SprT-like domain-containing protein [Methanonatronarchaeum sp. AMET6-2]